MITAKGLATKLNKGCRVALKGYSEFRSVGETRKLPSSPGPAYQFIIHAASPKGQSITSKAYITVYPELDVVVEHDQYFPEPLLHCVAENVPDMLTMSTIRHRTPDD